MGGDHRSNHWWNYKSRICQDPSVIAERLRTIEPVLSLSYQHACLPPNPPRSIRLRSRYQFRRFIVEQKKPINTRLGLLGTSLGLSPTGETGGQSNSQSGALTQGTNQNNIAGGSPTGRVPSGGEFSNTNTFDQCCCVPLSTQCGDPLGRDLEEDLVGLGLTDPRLQPQNQKNKLKQGLSTRIVNRPSATTNSQQNTCPRGQKACCYDSSVDHSLFGRTCISPGQAQNQETIRYGCNENRFSSSGKQCGTRNYLRPASNLNHGESSPGEFPWTCLVLNQNNDFIG